MGALVIKAMIHMVMDEGALRIGYGFLNRMELLCDLDAGFSFFHHRNDGTQMAFGAFQPSDQRRVACMVMWFCHIGCNNPPGGIWQDRGEVPVRAGVYSMKKMVAALLCLSLVLWSLQPNVGHAPKVIETIQEHREMIVEHGHSHGFEEDLRWAMHGHSHDGADHDHSQMILIAAIGFAISASFQELRVPDSFQRNPNRRARIDRPPRA